MDNVTEAGGRTLPAGLPASPRPVRLGPHPPSGDSVRDELDMAAGAARMCAYWVLDRDVTQKTRLEYAEKYAHEMRRHDANARAMLAWMQAETDRVIEETRP
jgi:hypothetical protein